MLPLNNFLISIYNVPDTVISSQNIVLNKKEFLIFLSSNTCEKMKNIISLLQKLSNGHVSEKTQ